MQTDYIPDSHTRQERKIDRDNARCLGLTIRWYHTAAEFGEGFEDTAQINRGDEVLFQGKASRASAFLLGYCHGQEED